MLQLENVEHAWLWIAGIAVGASILYATYRGIFRRTERRLTWRLMALRGVGLVALVLALAKPTWTRQADLVDPGRVAIVLDNSLSMSLADGSGKTSRYAAARAAIDRLREKFDAQSGGPALAVDLYDLEGKFLSSPPAEPRLERTDLARAIMSTLAQLRSKPLLGMVLVSDGMDNTGRQEFQELGDVPVPIFTVGFTTDPDASRLDLAVRNVQAPTRVIKNNEINVTVLVSKTGGRALEAKVTIKRGRDEIVSERISLPDGNAEQPVKLKFTPAEAGQFVYTAAISSEAGERSLSNNSQHFPLQVDADAIRVLYIEGYLRNEYKFLKRRFEDDPDVSMVSIVRSANPAKKGHGLPGELIDAERLKNIEVVLLGDMESDYLAPAEYQALLHWVNEGHGLMVLGGYLSFGPKGFRGTPLADALPVVFNEQPPFQSEDPFMLELTEPGKQHPVFEISGDRVKDALLWSAAPQLLGSSLVKRAKPGADVLAINRSTTVDGKPAIVLAAQRYGEGHTMAFTADTTWYWSRVARMQDQPDTLFSRFWSQSIRWLAGRELDNKRPPLVVSTDKPDYQVGKQVLIRAIRQPDPTATAKPGDVAAEVVDEQGKAVALQMRSSSGEPDVFSGTFYPAAGGRYQVSARLSGQNGPSANERTEFLVHGSNLELANGGTNPEQLRSIAALTGGVYYDVSECEKLTEKIERHERRITKVERTEFWNSPILFLVFLGTVTGEWILRRRNHLI